MDCDTSRRLLRIKLDRHRCSDNGLGSEHNEANHFGPLGNAFHPSISLFCKILKNADDQKKNYNKIPTHGSQESSVAFTVRYAQTYVYKRLCTLRTPRSPAYSSGGEVGIHCCKSSRPFHRFSWTSSISEYI